MKHERPVGSYSKFRNCSRRLPLNQQPSVYNRFSTMSALCCLESIRAKLKKEFEIIIFRNVPTVAVRGCHVVSVTDPYGSILGFSRPEPLSFLPNSSSIVLTRLRGPRSRPTSGSVARNPEH
jgi:hypothetical protein